MPAVILAKLNPNILDNTYILNVSTLTGFTYYMTFEHLELHRTRLSLVIILFAWTLPFRANIALRRYHLQLLPLTLRLIIVAEWTMMFFGGILTLYALFMGYIYQLLSLPTTVLTDSLQFCDGHDIQQLCAAFTLVRISRQMLINSAIYVGHDITYFTPDLITILRFVTLAGLDHYSHIRHIRRTLLLLTDLSFCRTWIFTPLVEFVGAASKPPTVRCYDSRLFNISLSCIRHMLMMLSWYHNVPR